MNLNLDPASASLLSALQERYLTDMQESEIVRLVLREWLGQRTEQLIFARIEAEHVMERRPGLISRAAYDQLTEEIHTLEQVAREFL
jgi:hypothetical protein